MGPKFIGMQNIDFAKNSRNRPRPQPARSGPWIGNRVGNGQFRPNMDFHVPGTPLPQGPYYSGQAPPLRESRSRRPLSVLYLASLFLFIGFSAGVGVGIYLTRESKPLNKILDYSQKGQTTADAGKAASEAPATMRNTGLNLGNLENLNSGQAREFLVYAGEFRSEVAYQLAYNLKKNKQDAFLVNAGKKSKIFIGPYAEAGQAQKVLKKVKKQYPQFFSHAAIKVHHPQPPG